jgi:transposase
MNNNLPREQDRERLNQLSKEELVEMIMRQGIVIEQLHKAIEELKQEIEKLRVSRDLDSKTSSKPPSSDLLKKPETQKQEEPALGENPKRKPGGQPGHPGKTRKGFGRVDRYELLQPEQCSCCGRSEFQDSPVGVERQVVAQLVERPIEIVEYQRQTCQCQYCGAIESANWPVEMIPGQDLGVSLQAFLVWMGNYGHLPYEKQQEMLWELGQIEIGVGTLVATNERVEKAITKSVNQLQDWVKLEQPNIHIDETPWAVKGIKEWLWVITNPQFCLFHAGDTRSRAELEAILGNKYRGVISSDDFSVYNGYNVAAQQKCLAHLRRHFKKLIQLPGLHNKVIGETFVNLIDEVFHKYHQWQRAGNDVTYNDWSTQFKFKLQSTLSQWFNLAGGTARILLRSLRDKAEQWWYFLDHPEVPPDNNLAERSLRLAVTKRKVSGGSRSMARFQDTANLLTVVQTCRRQGRSVIHFFEQALQSQLHSSQVPPSLIPHS